MSYVDLNRSGVALMEIVSRPDMRSPAEAGAYLRKLRSILRYVGVCDGNMEEGSMRADVNVSVRKPGGELGTRTETKNVNSVRFVMAVIEHEARRQVELIEERRRRSSQETRLFDPDKGVTRSLRSKEDAHDYRYFPDPDLLPLELDEAFSTNAARRCPSCPTPSASAIEGLGITRLQRQRADRRGRDRALVRRACSTAGAEPQGRRPTGSSSELFGALNRLGKTLADSPVSPRRPPSCSALVADGTISRQHRQAGVRDHARNRRGRRRDRRERGLKQTSDTGAIDAAIDEILAANADKVAAI